MRRTRFHQSWYRAHALGLRRWGAAPGPRGGPLGSVLHEEDAATGANFTSDSAKRLFLNRHSEGWGVDSTRCLRLLTSSQALTFNLFGPLVEDPDLAAHVLRHVTRRDRSRFDFS